jgi:hypothetical protein
MGRLDCNHDAHAGFAASRLLGGQHYAEPFGFVTSLSQLDTLERIALAQMGAFGDDAHTRRSPVWRPGSRPDLETNFFRAAMQR